MRAAILFLVFNRPDTTARVFEAIRRARPPRLYVAADGPRSGRAGEQQRCDEVRRIATAVDWPCELVTLLREGNLGCKRAVSSAISWFFEHEPEGIVLEDDCLPDPSFFPYCDELLERYRDDSHVMCISGDNFISDTWKPQESYYFSKFIHIWGWASWRRAWQLYDVDMQGWQRRDEPALLEQLMPNQRRAQAHWRACFDGVAGGTIDTWDYQWVYACWRHGGVSAMPAVNLISNIGFGPDATHTFSPGSKDAARPIQTLTSPLKHPAHVRADQWADAWSNLHVVGIDERPILMNPTRLKAAILRRLRRAWGWMASKS